MIRPRLNRHVYHVVQVSCCLLADFRIVRREIRLNPLCHLFRSRHGGQNRMKFASGRFRKRRVRNGNLISAAGEQTGILRKPAHDVRGNGSGRDHARNALRRNPFLLIRVRAAKPLRRPHAFRQADCRTGLRGQASDLIRQPLRFPAADIRIHAVKSGGMGMDRLIVTLGRVNSDSVLFLGREIPKWNRVGLHPGQSLNRILLCRAV